eukprot:scaffold43947_cov34-Prasinocladus_malaysianus.AAC.1
MQDALWPTRVQRSAGQGRLLLILCFAGPGYNVLLGRGRPLRSSEKAVASHLSFWAGRRLFRLQVLSLLMSGTLSEAKAGLCVACGAATGAEPHSGASVISLSDCWKESSLLSCSASLLFQAAREDAESVPGYSSTEVDRSSSLSPGCHPASRPAALHSLDASDSPDPTLTRASSRSNSSSVL